MPQYILDAADRLKCTQIEHRPAVEVVRKFNRQDVLIYADPPYLMGTRGGQQYVHEMSAADHEELLDALLNTRSMVMLSGYASPMYDHILRHWHRTEWSARNQNRAPRTEILWCNFEPSAEPLIQESLFRE